LVNRIISSVNPPKTSLSSSNLQRLPDSPDTYRKEHEYNVTEIYDEEQDFDGY
jgi:hypothetical protein